MTIPDVRIPDSLLPFSEALQHSMQLYEQTSFSVRQDTLLKALVDIIHDNHSLERLFQVCVTVPLLLGDIQARFYLYEKKADNFLCVCDSTSGLLEPPRPADCKLPGEIRTTREYDE